MKNKIKLPLQVVQVRLFVHTIQLGIGVEHLVHCLITGSTYSSAAHAVTHAVFAKFT